MKRPRISKPPISLPADVALRDGDIQSYSQINVSGQLPVQASGANRQLTLAAGPGVTFLLNDATQTVTVTAEAWPVGSIVHLYTSTAPATLFGYGTWTQIAQGRFIVGDNAGTFASPGTTGGATVATPSGTVTTPAISGDTGAVATHTHLVSPNISVDNHATHNHAINQSEAAPKLYTSSASGISGSTGGPSPALTHTVNNPTITSVAGGGHSHSPGTLAVSAPTFAGAGMTIVPPYYVCYIYRRTA